MCPSLLMYASSTHKVMQAAKSKLFKFLVAFLRKVSATFKLPNMVSPSGVAQILC